LNYVIAWYCILLAIFFVWRWGDNYRYLAFISLPTSVLSAQILLNLIPIILIVPPSIVSVLVIYKNIRSFIAYPEYSDLSKIKLPENATILVFPTSLLYAVAYYSGQKTLCGGANKDALVFELTELMPTVKRDIASFLDKYNITHLIIDKAQKEVMRKIPKKFHKIAEIKNHILYERLV
jgi:hypothetical protein